MKVVKNYLWNVLYQLFVMIVPLITMPYIARTLGPAGVGINSYTNSIVQYFILFGSIGISLYGNRQIAYEKRDIHATSQTFFEIFFLRVITISIAMIAYYTYIIIYDKYQSYFLAQSIQLIAAALDVSWFFMGMENFQVTVIRNIIVKVFSLLLIFLFVKDQSDLIIYIVLIGFSTFLGNITLFPYLRKYIVKVKLRTLNLWKHLLPATVLFVPQIAVQIYVVFNRTLLGSFVSVEAAGFYDNADKVVRIMIAIATAAGTVLLPHIASQFASGQMDKVKRSFYQSFDFVSFITFPLAFGLLAVANKFAVLFFGDKFVEVGVLLEIETLASFFMTFAYAIGSQYLLPTNQNKSYTVAVGIGAMANIICSIPLIFFAGAIGAMIATVISEFSVTLSMLLLVRKQLEIKKMFENFLKYLISSILMFLIVFFLDKQLPLSWLGILVEVSVGIIVWLLCMFAFKPTIIIKLKKIL